MCFNLCMALLPSARELLLSLPHPLIEMWVVWLILLPWQIGRLVNQGRTDLAKSGEIMSFREIIAVGCIGGFVLLSFITAFCIWLIMRSKGVL